MRNVKYTQEEMKEIFLPILNEDGIFYKKIKKILARPAKDGEYIATITADGLETVNKSEKGDYIIKNQTEAGEQYILKKEKFEKRYELLEEKTSNEFNLYEPKGQIIAIELTTELLKHLDLPSPFYFIPAWKGKMVAKINDYLACPTDCSEIYRIARKEFFETYAEL